MKDPKHPPAPDFEKAGDAAEETRQQQIARLSEQQREAFDKLGREQKDKEKALREKQQSAYRQQVAERMRKHLLQDRELHLRPGIHRHKLKTPQELDRALNDHLAGDKSALTKEVQNQFATAQKKAKNDIARENRQAQEKMQAGHEGKQDAFLKQAAKERRQDKTKEFGKEARAITGKRAAPEFGKAAQNKTVEDKAWQRAFEKAARSEADRGQDHERDPGHDINRER